MTTTNIKTRERYALHRHATIGSNSGQPSDSCSYDSIKELAADRGGSLPPIEYVELAGFGHETRFEAGAAFSVR